MRSILLVRFSLCPDLTGECFSHSHIILLSYREWLDIFKYCFFSVNLLIIFLGLFPTNFNEKTTWTDQKNLEQTFPQVLLRCTWFPARSYIRYLGNLYRISWLGITQTYWWNQGASESFSLGKKNPSSRVCFLRYLPLKQYPAECGHVLPLLVQTIVMAFASHFSKLTSSISCSWRN